MNTPTNKTKNIYPRNLGITLNGPTGKLEALYSPATKNAKHTAIICHPHPLYGGTMHNKVVYTLHKTLKNLNINTIRFNFRGVGNSEGYYDHGQGEINDAATAYQWTKEQNPNTEIILAGFSFGAYISTILSQNVNTKLLITIAPPIERFNFKDTNPKCPWLIIQPR